MKNNKILTLLLAVVYQSCAQAETANSSDINILRQEISAMQQQLDKLTTGQSTDTSSNFNGLQLSGFFDVMANVSDLNEHPFDLGDLEVDVAYEEADNFAVSASGIVNNDGTSIAVAILDYHVSSHTTPSRGELYEEEGYHIQIGRFDIPFASDYSFYAAPDRINISAPLTTSRVQSGGLNGDGMRIYGAWSGLEYTAFATNSLLGETGYSAGTRLGYAVNDSFVIGLSAISDLDKGDLADVTDDTRIKLTALDIGFNMGIAEFNIEAVQRDSQNDMLVNSISQGPADEKAAHISMALNFEPVTVFVRYEKWTPDYTQAVDPTDNTLGYNVEELERATIALRYALHDYLQFKIEYSSYINGVTAEPEFVKNTTKAQMVARF